MRIAIIIGSTRPGRKGEAVAEWVHSHAAQRSDATFELVDIAAYNLPLLDEPFPPSTGKYTKPHTQVWAAKIGSFDCGQSVVPGWSPRHALAGAPRTFGGERGPNGRTRGAQGRFGASAPTLTTVRAQLGTSSETALRDSRRLFAPCQRAHPRQ